MGAVNGAARRRARAALDRRDAGHPGHPARVARAGSARASSSATCPAAFQWFGHGQAAGQWLVVAIALAGLAGLRLGLRNLAAGRAVYATGSDPEAARLAGIRPRRVVFGVFVIMGASPGLAALLNAVRFADVDPNAGAGLELQVIAAVVVGGVADLGRARHPARHPVGVALLGSIGPALVFLGTQPQWEKAIQGVDHPAGGRLRRALPGGADDVGPCASPARRDPAPRLASSLRSGPRRVLVVEIVVFSRRSAQLPHARERASRSLRLSVEIGLLAVALTPVIVSGGIDLSVGSLMGLSAVVFGKLWRDAGPADRRGRGADAGPRRAGRERSTGCSITRLRIPPLIVTLGSFSLFRGLAEGLTGGVDNFTNFPESFLFLGQGYLLGEIPRSCPIFVAVAVGVLGLAPPDDDRPGPGRRSASRPRGRGTPGCRSTGGSAWSTCSRGWSRASRRSSTSPTSARPRPTPARATSCWRSRRWCWAARRSSAAGGASTAPLLGLFAIAVLQNGLRLADLPAGARRRPDRRPAAGRDRARSPVAARTRGRRRRVTRTPSRRLTVKNSQVAVICAVILPGP